MTQEDKKKKIKELEEAGISVYKPKHLDREIRHKQVPETIKRLEKLCRRP
ncbi:MAG: hypothetical protein KKA10_03050 [Euryarchaeota archaeon]|nr:hypothetical protein [Euryarchaeota archaeon]MCG2736820.1 hypothetical protein [Candidatus Methanoperedenaceae archaeon]